MIKNILNKTVQGNTRKQKQGSGNSPVGNKNAGAQKRKRITIELKYEDVPDLPHPQEVEYPSAKKNPKGIIQQKKVKANKTQGNKKEESEISEKSTILTEEEEVYYYDEENQ